MSPAGSTSETATGSASRTSLRRLSLLPKAFFDLVTLDRDAGEVSGAFNELPVPRAAAVPAFGCGPQRSRGRGGPWQKTALTRPPRFRRHGPASRNGSYVGSTRTSATMTCSRRSIAAPHGASLPGRQNDRARGLAPGIGQMGPGAERQVRSVGVNQEHGARQPRSQVDGAAQRVQHRRQRLAGGDHLECACASPTCSVAIAAPRRALPAASCLRWHGRDTQST